MNDQLHNALKSEAIETKSIPNFQLALARLQWGKTEIGYSLHVGTNTWISSGMQSSAFLQHLGFEHGVCQFLHGECWAKSVPEGFDLAAFASALEGAFNGMREVEKKLNSCGIPLIKERSRRTSYYGGGSDSYYGDGHTAAGTPKKMKEGSDDHFDFVFTFQETPEGKGWTVHRHSKGEKMNPDFLAALKFLEMERMGECPQFDFEECHWSFIPLRGEGFDGNANYAHGTFEAHPKNFTEAVHQLASINAMLKPYE